MGRIIKNFTKDDLSTIRGLAGPKGWYVEQQQEKNKNMKEVRDLLIDAIKSSGKKFSEIPKKSIIEYLDKVGLNKSQHDKIYNQLVEFYKLSEPNINKMEDSDRNSGYKVVDYTDTTHNDVKDRQPRKNVFSEIVKIK